MLKLFWMNTISKQKKAQDNEDYKINVGNTLSQIIFILYKL